MDLIKEAIKVEAAWRNRDDVYDLLVQGLLVEMAIKISELEKKLDGNP